MESLDNKSDALAMQKFMNEVKPAENWKKEEIMARYAKWAPTFDEDGGKYGYKAPEMAAERTDYYTHLLGLDSNASILDLLAGSGQIGKHLNQKYGFSNIDAIDGCNELLQILKKNGFYKNAMNIWIDSAIPLDDDSYDVVVITGGIAPSHIEEDMFPEIIRIIKPGGVFINIMRHDYLSDMNVKQMCENFVEAGYWKCLEESIPEEKYFMNYDAFIMVYQIEKPKPNTN